MASSRPVVLAWVATIGIMSRPEVRYARAEDGVAIGYSVVGDGPVTIVVVSPLVSQLELAWEEPALGHFWSGSRRAPGWSCSTGAARACRIARRRVSVLGLRPWPWISRRSWTHVTPGRRYCSG